MFLICFALELDSSEGKKCCVSRAYAVCWVTPNFWENALTAEKKIYPLEVPLPGCFLPLPFSLSFLTSLYCGFYLDFLLLCLKSVFLYLLFSWNFLEELVMNWLFFWFVPWICCIRCDSLLFSYGFDWFFWGVICHKSGAMPVKLLK